MKKKLSSLTFAFSTLAFYVHGNKVESLITCSDMKFKTSQCWAATTQRGAFPDPVSADSFETFTPLPVSCNRTLWRTSSVWCLPQRPNVTEVPVTWLDVNTWRYRASAAVYIWSTIEGLCQWICSSVPWDKITVWNCWCHRPAKVIQVHILERKARC